MSLAKEVYGAPLHVWISIGLASLSVIIGITALTRGMEEII